MPVPEDERIKVKLTDDVTGGFVEEEDRPGVLVMTLVVPPKETVAIVFGYEVRHPKDLIVPLP